MDINNGIRLLSEFLNNSWNITLPLFENRDYTSKEEACNDWLQCCWEMLIERHVLRVSQYLEVYGEGADFNGYSSRITDFEKMPTHRVKAKPLNSKKCFDILKEEFFDIENLYFEKLVGISNGYIAITPEFNYALFIDKQTIKRVVSISDISFYLEQINTPPANADL